MNEEEKKEIREKLRQVFLSGHSTISEVLEDLYFRLQKLEKEVIKNELARN